MLGFVPQPNLPNKSHYYRTISFPMNYRRAFLPGRTYFFTAVTCVRQRLFDDSSNVSLLRDAFRYVMDRHPFEINACVILPDHIHTIWTLAEDDGDYPTRWRLLKSFFTRKLITRSKELITSSRKMKGEQAVWQRRYWEHLIIDAEDLDRHLNYIHYNPVKHGLVKQVKDWPWSSFHRFVRSGLYPADWGSDERFTTKTDDEVWKLAE